MSPVDSLGKIERVFHRFDENGDGKISATELQLLMMVVGEELSLEDAEAVVKSVDSDGDGLLSLEEFSTLANKDEGNEEEEEEEKELREAFRMYEMDGESCITPMSLKRTLSRLGMSRDIDDCTAMICRFDLDGDGVLSFEEFRVLML